MAGVNNHGQMLENRVAAQILHEREAVTPTLQPQSGEDEVRARITTQKAPTLGRAVHRRETMLTPGEDTLHAPPRHLAGIYK